MADKLLDKWKNLSLMVEEANEITMGNALCSRNRKERKSLSSYESFDGLGHRMDVICRNMIWI